MLNNKRKCVIHEIRDIKTPPPPNGASQVVLVLPKIDLPFLAVCITCVFMTFGGVCERFWQVLASLYSSLNSSYIFTWCLTQVSQTRNVGVRTVALTCDQAFFLKREREKNNARNNYKTNRQPPPNLNKLRCG